MFIRAIRNVVMSCALLFSVVGLSAVGAAQNKKPAHLPGSNPDSGAQLYKRFCAVCHANDLKGQRPHLASIQESAARPDHTRPTPQGNSRTDMSRMCSETVSKSPRMETPRRQYGDHSSGRFAERILTLLSPDFQFEPHQTNLWMSIVICIYAGLNAVRPPWRCTPNG